MQPEDFKYILESYTYEDKQNIPFERRYFQGLHEAFIGLLQIPPSQYGPDSNDSIGKEISTVKVLELRDGIERQIASTFEMPISDCVPDGPSAGIYLHNDDGLGREGSIEELEDRLITTGFYKLRTYDRGLPMVQIARYVYDDALEVLGDPGIKELVADLRRSVPTPWEYCLKVLDAQDNIPAVYFHHPTMVGAFNGVLDLKYLSPGADNGPIQLPDDLPTIMVSDRLGVPIVAVKEYSHYPDQRYTNPGPFLVMEVTGGFGRLEAMADVNLSAFADYSHDGHRMVIGQVDPATRIFSPVPALAALQGHDLGSPLVVPSANYTLQLEYRQLQPVNIKQALSAATFTTATFADINDAVTAMKKLELDAFDVATAIRKGEGQYLHQATIYHSIQGNEIASMFHVTRPQPELPAGTYMKIHPDHLSTETLRALHPFVEHLPGKGPLLFLVKQDTVQHQQQPRRRPSGPRHFDAGGTYGNSL